MREKMEYGTTGYFSLMIPPWPEYQTGKYVRFLQNEKHMTRYFFEFVIIFMLNNSLHFSEEDRDITLNAGEWYIQLPGLRQEGKVPSPGAEYFYIHFKGNRLQLSHYENSQCSLGDIAKLGRLTMPVRGNFDQQEFLPLFERLKSLQISLSNIISEQSVFLEILEKLAQTIIIPQSKNKTLADNIQEYLAVNFNKQVALSELSNVFSYSADYLTKIFKDEYGMAPSYYVKKKRVGKAKELLIHTDKSISEIAEISGYNDETVFFRAFKQLTGVSPSAWRNMNKFL
jgi:AraC-like DNA-binding protein